MTIYFMHHPESSCLFTVESEEERDEALMSDENVCEVSEETYQSLQAEYGLR